MLWGSPITQRRFNVILVSRCVQQAEDECHQWNCYKVWRKWPLEFWTGKPVPHDGPTLGFSLPKVRSGKLEWKSWIANIFRRMLNLLIGLFTILKYGVKEASVQCSSRIYIKHCQTRTWGLGKVFRFHSLLQVKKSLEVSKTLKGNDQISWNATKIWPPV